MGNKKYPYVALLNKLRSIPPMDLEVAESLFLSMNKILNRQGIKFWLHAGTALGAVRDKGFIPYDVDIDLVSLAGWDFVVMEKEIKNAGFDSYRVITSPLYKDKPSGVKVVKQGIEIDISFIFYYLPEDLILLIMGNPTNYGTLFPAQLYRGENFVNFLGVKVRIPYPPEEYFPYIYGPRWRIPCDDWSWLKMREFISIKDYTQYFCEHPKLNHWDMNP